MHYKNNNNDPYKGRQIVKTLLKNMHSVQQLHKQMSFHNSALTNVLLRF